MKFFINLLYIGYVASLSNFTHYFSLIMDNDRDAFFTFYYSWI